MKQLVLALICVISVLSVSAQKKAQKVSNKATVTYYISDMHCNSCIKKIEGNIAFEKGVTDLKCDLSKKTVTVTYKNDKTTEVKIKEGFKKIGFNVEAINREKKSNKQVGY